MRRINKLFREHKHSSNQWNFLFICFSTSFSVVFDISKHEKRNKTKATILINYELYILFCIEIEIIMCFRVGKNQEETW